MSTDTKAPGHTDANADSIASLVARVGQINDATRGVFEALITATDESGTIMPKDAQTALGHALTLINCGVIALTEIADAQQRMAALSERDIADAIASAVDDAAEAKAAVKVAETTRRSFIGQKKNDA